MNLRRIFLDPSRLKNDQTGTRMLAHSFHSKIVCNSVVDQ